MSFTATYSPEDNKLRIYAPYRLDEDEYKEFKEAGFRWAKIQELFFTYWSPKAEDLCLKYAGEIEAEQLSLAERAQAKVERLEALAEKREAQAHSYAATARRISERFAYGQPILVGHHSERKARKDKQAMESNQERAVKCLDAAQHWCYKATGVERHANRKQDPLVRAGRIKTLLKDLRDQQNYLNHGYLVQKLWNEIADIEDPEVKRKNVIYWAGGRLKTGYTTPNWDYYSQVRDNEITEEEVIEKCLAYADSLIHCETTHRKIIHLLNRLAYERSELGEVPLFTDKLTPAILQTFAREQGVLKPKATKTDTGYLLKSPAPLPLHIGEGESLELAEQDWRELMQQVGHTVAEKKPAKPPILNFRADEFRAKGLYNRELTLYSQIELTTEEYRKLHSDYKYIQTSICGRYRFRVGIDPNDKGLGYRSPRYAIFINDAKTHPAPEPLQEDKAA